MDLTSDDVQDILELLDSLPYGELHLQTSRFRLSLCRTSDGAWTQQMEVLTPPNVLPTGTETHPAPWPPAAVAPGAPSPPPPAPADSGAPDRQADGLTEVRAPLLGTFYRASGPGEEPFVAVGSHVEADTVVGIIETMKLMNSVCAGVRGTVAEILIANAQFAAQDTPLMRIREER